MYVGGKFSAMELSDIKALEVLDEPRKLIDVSRQVADAVAAQAGGAAALYTTASGTVPAFEYQCSGSARWLVENLDEYYSRRAASAFTEHARLLQLRSAAVWLTPASVDRQAAVQERDD